MFCYIDIMYKHYCYVLWYMQETTYEFYMCVAPTLLCNVEE